MFEYLCGILYKKSGRDKFLFHKIGHHNGEIILKILIILFFKQAFNPGYTMETGREIKK